MSAVSVRSPIASCVPCVLLPQETQHCTRSPRCFAHNFLLCCFLFGSVLLWGSLFCFAARCRCRCCSPGSVWARVRPAGSVHRQPAVKASSGMLPTKVSECCHWLLETKRCPGFLLSHAMARLQLSSPFLLDAGRAKIDSTSL